jgi:hypothetical protein
MRNDGLKKAKQIYLCVLPDETKMKETNEQRRTKTKHNDENKYNGTN